MMDGANFPPPKDDEAQPRAGARWETVQHLYTVNSGSAPPANTLLIGELGLELADPVKIWAGVPTSMDATGRKLLYDSSKGAGAAFPEAPLDGLVYGRQGSTASWLGVLPLTGGTLSGALTIQSTSDATLYVHATGPSWPAVKWNTDLAGTAAGYFESQRYGKSRWSVEFGGTERETGFDAGTNFLINRFDDNGNVKFPTPFAITRATGYVHFGSLVFLATDPNTDLEAATKHYVDQQSPANKYLLLTGGTINPGPLNIENLIDNPRLNLTGLSGIGSYWPIITLNVQATTGSVGIIQSQRNGARRWTITLGDGFTPEVLGSSAGTDLIVSRYDDFGGLLGNVLTIARGSGNTTLNAALIVAGTVLLQAGDPTTDQGAATKHYVDIKAGGYLPLTGGRLSGGLSFGTRYAANAQDLSAHIALYDGWGGFSITPGHLNVVAGGALALSFDGPSIFVAPNTGLYVNRDPSTDMEVVNLRYLNANTVNIAGGDARWVNVTGDTMSGNLMISSPSQQTAFVVNAPMGTSPGYAFYIGGRQRWFVGVSPDLEDGSGFGSNLAFYSYHDDGSFSGTPLWIDRQDGYLWVQNTISVGRDPITSMEVVTLEYARANYAPITGGGYLPLTAGPSYPLTNALYIDSTTTGLAAAIHLTTPGWPAVVWNTTTNSVTGGNTAAGYFASQRQGRNRWSVEFGGTQQETGGNQGTDFLINRFDDGGNVLYPSPFGINRQLGTVTILPPLMLAGPPTTTNQAATMGYVDGKAGNYLPLGGGIMQGGISWADVYGQSPSDATHHLILHSGFGIGVTANRLNYIADINSEHSFIAGSEVAWFNTYGLGMAAGTDIYLARDPTSALQATTKRYADLMLPLAGGVMTGGIRFNDNNYLGVAGRPDTSHHITLFSGYGFSITTASLNIVSTDQIWFSNSQSGHDIAYFRENVGLAFVGITNTVTVGRDPTAKMEVVTKQYADGLIGAAGGPFLPIVAGFNNALTGELYLPHVTPTVDEMATPKFYVDLADQNLQSQISAVVSGNLVFYGQLDVANDVVHYKYTVNLPDTPMPSPSAVPKGGYIIVTVGGIPPTGTSTNIPPLPLGTPQYVRGDWFISDGEIWIFLPTGLVYFTADAVEVSPPIQGTTDVQATLTWLNTNKLNLAGGTMQGQLLQPLVPTTGTSLVNRNYVTSTLGGYLALSGGTMLGGISFDDSLATGSTTDTSKYLTLHSAGYGFGVSAYRLNYTVSATDNHYFIVGGIDKLWVNSNGVGTSCPVYLGHDPPTTGSEAASKNYVDGRTPLATDAPNDTWWWGRHAATWAPVSGLQYIGAGAYDLNAVGPGAYIGLLNITNQTNAPNWPTDLWAQTALVLHGYNSNYGWQNQILMGPAQNTGDAAIWYRNQSGGVWSPWWRIMTAAGGTFTGRVTFNGAAVAVFNAYTGDVSGVEAIVISGNGNLTVPTPAWSGGLSWNLTGGGSELSFVNNFTTTSRSFSWWQVDSATAMRQLGWFSPNGDLSVTGAVYLLKGDPSTSTQAANKNYVDGVITRAGGPFLPIIGGTLSGNLGLNGAWPTITLDTASGMARQIMGTTVGSPRWLIRLGDNTSEAGNNLGSDFNLWRYADNGSDAWIAFFIKRQTGDVTVGGTIFVGTDPTQNMAVATKQYVDAVRTALGGYLPLTGGTLSGLLTAQASIQITGGALWSGWNGAGGAQINLQGVPGSYRSLTWYSGNYRLWDIGNSSSEPRDGSNTGGDLVFYRYDDAANILGSPLMIMRASGAVMLDRDPTANLQAATKQYVDTKSGNFLPITGGTLTGRLNIQFTADSTTGHLFLAPANFSGNALEGKLRFGGTFGIGVGDTGVRLTSSIRSGFRSNAWGYEYLDVWINNGNPNDASSDINQVMVASFNRFGLTMPASMAITLSADPTADLQAATKQYADGIILRNGGPWLPIAGGEITGNLQVDGVFTIAANASTISGMQGWGGIVGNLTQGQGEVDFVALYTGYGGFSWWQAQPGYVKVQIAQLQPNGTFATWGLGHVYYGLPHGGNVVGFSWYGGWLNAYVDGNFIGYLATSDFLSQTYLALTGGNLSGGIHFTGVASGWNDLTKHIDLHGGNTGFSVDSGGTLNYVFPGVSNIFAGGGFIGQISSTGLNNFNIGQSVAGLGTFTVLRAVGDNPQINIDGPAATWRTLQFYTAGAPRWNFQVNAGTEPGGNAGSDFGITRWTDAGAPIDQPLMISRATGQVNFSTTVGPLHFGNRIAPNNNGWDTSAHITLWDTGYGFSITGGTLNVVAGQTIQFWSGQSSLGYFTGGGGLVMANGSTVTLGRDPTAAMEAVTLQYFQANGAPSGAYLPIDGSVAMTPGNLRLNAGATPPTARTITGQTAGVDEWCIFLGGMNHAPFAITKYIGVASYQPGISIDWTTLNVTLLGNLTVNKTQGTISVNDPGGAYAQLGAYPGGGTLSVYGSNSQITLANAGSGHINSIVGYSGTTYQRWSIAMGNATPESGSNLGSDFSIARFSDTGVQLGTPFAISRQTGNIAIAQTLFVNNGRVVSWGTGNVAHAMWNTTAALGSAMWLGNDGVLWFGIADSTGTPTGGQVSIDRSNNLTANGLYGSYVQSYGSIMCNSGTFYVAANTNYYLSRGTNGTWSFVENNVTNFTIDGSGNAASKGELQAYANLRCAGAGVYYTNIGVNGFNFRWNGTNIFGRVDNAVEFQLSNQSDERRKTDIAPSTFDCLAAVLASPLFQFRWKDATEPAQMFTAAPKADAPLIPIGFVAQRQHAVFPESVFVGGEINESAEGATSVWSMDHNTICAALCGAVQQLVAMNEALAARVATLEARTLH
jgi:hypothetical protein